VQLHRQPVSGDTHRLQKLFPKNFSRIHRPARRTFILNAHLIYTLGLPLPAKYPARA
jgi:hypothetical protein